MKVTVKFYADPGHGWAAVKRKTLVELGILDKITYFSYQRGQSVYLEEDCDLSTFITAMREAGKEVEFKHSHTNKSSPIRSYDRFTTATIA